MQPLEIIDQAVARYEQTLAECYRELRPESRARLLAKLVLQGLSATDPNLRELAQQVLADNGGDEQ